MLLDVFDKNGDIVYFNPGYITTIQKKVISPVEEYYQVNTMDGKSFDVTEAVLKTFVQPKEEPKETVEQYKVNM